MSIAISKPRRKPRGRPVAAVPEFPVARMTVPEYLSLVDSGFFGTRRVELWEGWVIDRMTHGSLPAMIISIFTRWLGKRLSDEYALRIQLPIQTNDSCPEPDVTIVRGSETDFEKRHPEPREVELLVEISDATLTADRGAKSRLYASAGVREYWIVNCQERQVEIYTDPHATAKMPHYRKLTTYLPGETVSVHVAGKKLGELAVSSLFGTGKSATKKSSNA